MSTANTHSLKPNGNGQGKDNSFKTQSKTIFNFLLEHTATNTMVSKATGIPQKNICRIKRDLEKKGLLQEVQQRLCKITGHKAFYLTTNKDLFLTR